MTEPFKRIEREFGVPFPGDILPQEQWTQTALRAIPDGPLDAQAIFGRKAPLVLDLGCGNGRSTLHLALQKPECDLLGVDTLPVVIRYARRRGNQRGFTNAMFAVLGGLDLLERHIAPRSIREIHAYHPQPYYDATQVHRRLITPHFVSLVHRSLEPGGTFVIQTDNPGYWRYIREIVPVFFDFHERIGRWPDAPRGRTRREIIAMKKKLPVFRGHGVAKQDLSEDVAMRLAESLPPPTFDADRRLRELDRLE